MGHRKYRRIYSQGLRLGDEREAVVINKLALKYREMKGNLAITNVDKASGGQVAGRVEKKKQLKESHRAQQR